MKNSSDLKAKNFGATTNFQSTARTVLGRAAGSLTFVMPMVARASVEGSLISVQEKLIGTLLPLAAICGLGIAALSFVAGHPSARQHLIYAIFGVIIGFGAESIVAFIRGMVH